MNRFATLRTMRVPRVLASATALFLVAGSSAFANHDFKITNAGDHSIYEVHISGVDQRDWGPDLLGSEQTIDPGESLSFNIVQGCREDIKLVYRETDSEKRDFDTCKYDLKANY
ncbi:MAG: hypothetical protein ACREM2_02055 [Vulcanimicrobiaceae bacterium]